MQVVEQKATIGEKINEFIQKHRKPIYISAGAALVLLVGGIVTISLMDFVRGNAISTLEGFSSRYETLSNSIVEDANSVEELRAELEAFAQKNSGYAGGKAWSLVGTIYSGNQHWAEAEAAWAQAAKAAAKTYLGPIALFNAGAAAEEQGKTEEAIGYYSASLASAELFPAAPRAQFAIGRIRESRNENAAAIEAYRAVISGWPYERTWSNLAYSRIIVLETK